MAKDGQVGFKMFEADLHSGGAADMGGKTQHESVKLNGTKKDEN